MLDFLAPLLVGLVGGLHCIGMCGPIVLAYSLQASPGAKGVVALGSASILHHMGFHLGRILSYGFLGLLAGAVAQVVNLQAFMGNLRAWASLLGGSAMVCIGLALLRLLPVPPWLSRSYAGVLSAYTGPWVGRALSWSGLKGRVLLGIATGFLPCMLPWAMMVKAATTSGMLQALITMLLFGVGTVPLLLLLGISATAVSAKLRLTGERIAALAVTAMGLILALKGARALLRICGLLP